MSHPDPQVVEVDHPLIRHKLTLLRDVSTDTRDFRRLVHELALLVCYEATRTLVTEDCEVQTPLEVAAGVRIPPSRVTIVPVLRAGLGMLDAVLALLPASRVGFLGVYRDESTLEAVPYYAKLPFQIDGGDVLLLDPMLATGGSASHSITVCKEAGARDVRLLSLIAAPEGIARVRADHPDTTVYTAAIDRGLDENGYIRPGLGDAGDRLYGNP
jgi:uracil phosphoribosyltransferase